MKYSIETLTRDVMARLGEITRPQASYADLPPGIHDIPSPQDVIALKVRSMLPEVGSRLILQAPIGFRPPEGGEPISASPSEVRMAVRLMPCGLYAAEVALPEDFLRMGSVRMGEWRHAVSEAVGPADSGWARQWSAEAGIAGCPARPSAYLDRTAAGVVLRLMGSRAEEDALDFLTVWRIPVPDADGDFRFPAILYPELVSSIAGSLS